MISSYIDILGNFIYSTEHLWSIHLRHTAELGSSELFLLDFFFFKELNPASCTSEKLFNKHIFRGKIRSWGLKFFTFSC